MNTIVFDIKGSFAHFRKFYANSTSLSYEFPPRTTVCGLIAGILGMNRDSYYQFFSEERAFIAVQIVYPTKRISQTINYMWVKSNKDLNGSAGRMQVPVEWITHHKGIGRGEVCYRIYFSHQEAAIYKQLRDCLRDQKISFPVYLGISEALASVDFVGEFTMERKQLNEQTLKISSVCPIHLLQDISYRNNPSEKRMYMRDRIPCEFNDNRELSGIMQAVYETNGYGMVAKVKKFIYKLQLKTEEVHILPMCSSDKGVETHV